MWIKALDRPIWVNMKHITHFEIEHKALGHGEPPYHVAYAYLNASGSSISKPSGPAYQKVKPVSSSVKGAGRNVNNLLLKNSF